MQTLTEVKRRTKDAIAPIAVRLFPVWWKQFNELYYWKSKKKAEEILSNEHYQYFYTTQFGLNETDYQDKTIFGHRLRSQGKSRMGIHGLTPNRY